MWRVVAWLIALVAGVILVPYGLAGVAGLMGVHLIWGARG